jgi:hypothetical protein
LERHGRQLLVLAKGTTQTERKAGSQLLQWWRAIWLSLALTLELSGGEAVRRE